MSHYRSTPEHWPPVFYVRLFYMILIPTIIGGMLVFVISDYARRIVDRRKTANDG